MCFLIFRNPVKDIVLLLPHADQKVHPQLPHRTIGRGLLKFKRTAHLQVRSERHGEVLAQHIGVTGRDLFLTNSSVALGLRRGLQALPGQRALVEKHADEGKRFHVVTARQLVPQVRVHTGVARGAGERPALLVWDMHLCLQVNVFLSEAEVNQVEVVPSQRPEAETEVLGLEIAVDEAPCVYPLHLVDHLLHHHADRLHAEPLSAVGEEFLEVRPQQVHHHDIEVALLTHPVQRGDARHLVAAAVQQREHFCFPEQLGELSFDAFQLDGNLCVRGLVCALIDVTERACTELVLQLVLFPNTEFHFVRRINKVQK
eukprot:PhM_4_TR10854/c0_g1_i1/m.86520